MAATVELKVSVTGAQGAIQDLTRVNTLVTNLSGAKSKIDLGINAAQARAIGQAARGLAELQKQQNAAKGIAEKTAQAQIAANAKTETALINSAGKIATAQINADAKKVASAEKTAQEQIKADAKVAAAAEKTTQEELKLQRATQGVGGEMQNASVGADAFAVALGNIAARAAHAAIAKLRQAFNEALGTMREVDQELANIQKVTDESDDVIAKVGDTAYDTASKYGVAANEYLKSAGDFAKAGYDNYTQMAELATKTQLVGDVNAEVATKFLLSADAAFKFGGDMEKLSSTLDKANVIENNYATSIEKLAEGFPLVAATASMANMTVDETLAAIGTITAKTQESGTMAARALRALILNILGDTQTEIEDGVTWTEEELKTMNGLLWKYAEEPMRKAQADGTVVNPMEAIKALHEAYTTGLLTQKELTDIAMDLGGKLRTNQLLALIENYDTFNEMLGKTADSAGSADREIDVMLGTWNAKVNQLKNSWTELVSEIVDTNLIKGGLDWLTEGIQGATDSLQRIKDFLAGPDYVAAYDDIQSEMAELESREGLLADHERRRLEYLRAISAEYEKQAQAQIQADIDLARYNAFKGASGWTWSDENGNYTGEAQQVSGAEEYNRQLLSLIRHAREEYLDTNNVEEYRKSLEGIVSEYSDVYENLNEINNLGGELNESEGALLDNINAVKEASAATDEQIREANSETANQGDTITQFWRTAGSALHNVTEEIDAVREAQKENADAIEETRQRMEEAEEAMNNATDEDARDRAAQEYSDAYAQYIDLLAESASLQNQLNELAGITGATLGDMGGAAEDVGGGLESATESAATFAAGLAPALGILQQMAAVAGYIVVGGGSSAKGGIGSIKSGGVHASAYGTVNAAGGPTLVNELGPELISDNGRAYIANGGRPGVVNLSPGAIVIPADETKQALRGGMPRYARAGRINTGAISDAWNSAGNAVIPSRADYYMLQLQDFLDAVDAAGGPPEKPKDEEKKNNNKYDGGGGGSSAAEAAKSIEDIAKETSDLLSNLDKQAKLANNQKNYTKEADLYRQAQDAITQMVNDYRAAGYSDTSNEILDLLNKQYDYQQKQLNATLESSENRLSLLDVEADIAQDANDFAKAAKLYGDAQSTIAQMIQIYKNAGYAENSKEIRDLQKKQNAYAEKQTQMQEKQLDLEINGYKDILKNLELQADIAAKQGNYEKQAQLYEQAQEVVKQMHDTYKRYGYGDTSDEVLGTLKQNYSYADKQLSIYNDLWDNLIDALENDTDAQDLANKIAEKQQAVDDARAALENAQRQRTVRMYNAATGQWEWVADQSQVDSAQKSLADAEEAYSEEVKNQAIAEIKAMKDTVHDLNEVVLGPALSAVAMMAETTDQFQNFARALNAVYGVGSYLQSTEGSSKVLSTADSHDTIYTFGNVTLTEEEASTMSVAQLAQKLQVLKIS